MCVCVCVCVRARAHACVHGYVSVCVGVRVFVYVCGTIINKWLSYSQTECFTATILSVIMEIVIILVTNFYN